MMARTTMTAAIYQKVRCLYIGQRHSLYQVARFSQMKSYEINYNYISRPLIILLMQVFSLNQVTISRLSIGHIINLTTNDVQRFENVSN